MQISTLLGHRPDGHDRDPGLGCRFRKARAASVRVVILLAQLVDLFGSSRLAGFSFQDGANLRQGGDMAGRDREHLNDGRAEVACNDLHITGLGTERRGGNLGVGNRSARFVGIAHHVNADRFGNCRRILTSRQTRGDRLGRLSILGGDLNETACFRLAQGILAEVELLLDFRLGNRGICRDQTSIETNDGQNPKLGPHQLRGVLLHELGQLCVGRRGDGWDRVWTQGKVTNIARLGHVDRAQRAVSPRNSHAIDDGRD